MRVPVSSPPVTATAPSIGVRRVNGHYDLRQVPAAPESSLVAVRAIRASSFAQQPGWVYFAGYDANKSAAHNTAWIIRGPSAGVISGL